MSKKRYAIVGTGGRAVMYQKAVCETYATTTELVAVCDINPVRAKNWLELGELSRIPVYPPEDFRKMIAAEKVECVIVTSMDRTHDRYICEAMRGGCDVITEKPMTTDEEKCREILRTQRETGRRIQVTFNYRYAPRNSRVKEVLQEGIIGEINSVHFEWLLDTKHGADYFRRWHREKRNSGGLLVHKCTHHFDMVNWWIDSVPEAVCVLGGLRFYGRENSERHGFGRRYPYATGHPNAEGDPFALHLDKDKRMRELYEEPSQRDGYRRDQNVFGDGISIEDDLSAAVQYRSKATMSYHLTAYSPWEGYRIMFNGSRGRLQFEVVEKPYVSGTEGDHNLAVNVMGGTERAVSEPVSLVVHPHWSKPQSLPVEESNEGGHGGADQRMLAEIFAGSGEADSLGRRADHVAGAWSILTGIAGNRSLAERRLVRVDEFGLGPYLDE